MLAFLLCWLLVATLMSMFHEVSKILYVIILQSSGNLVNELSKILCGIVII